MKIGYLLFGIACLIYMVGVAYFGGIKKSPCLIKIVKLKLGKNMTDEKAAKLCLIFGLLVGAVGVFLLVFGAVQGV